MERRTLLTLALTALAAGAAAAQPPAVVTVVGTDDALVDRQAIQNAIDAAGPGAIVELVGTFQLDGEAIRVGVDHLELRGALVDDDGDGRFHEDWPDGRDNDGDGAVDEDDWDAVLLGVTGPGGDPVLDDGVTGLYNRGFVVDGAFPPIEGLVIRDLAFEGFNRAVELWPEWATPTGHCDDRVQVPGSMRFVRIEGNRFNGNNLGVTLLGGISDSSVSGNVFERTAIFGAVAEGGSNGCPVTGGDSVDLDLTSPRRIAMRQNLAVETFLGTSVTEESRAVDNRFEGGVFGFISLSDSRMLIERNRVTGTAAGILVAGAEDSLVARNTVSDSFIGIDLSDPSEEVVVAANDISATLGVIAELGASGYRIIENGFLAGGFVDVWLFSDSTGNLVVNGGPPITVLDEGTDNRLVGNITLF